MGVVDNLVRLNEAIGVAECEADRAFFEALLAERFVMVRPSGRMDGRAEVLAGLATDAERTTENINVTLVADNRAIVTCINAKWPIGRPDEALRYHNLRIFWRPTKDAPWLLVSWLSEPVAEPPTDPTPERTTMSTDRLRVVVCTPLTDENVQLMVDSDPRIDVVVEQDLLPPMRWPGDHEGAPSFSRTPEQQARFDALVDTADALYGIPDGKPAALARTVAANPKLRWVQTMAAGGGAQVKAANLSAADLARVTFSTSAGPHSTTLGEFALFGVLAGAKDLPRLQTQKAAKQWSGRWAMKQLSEMTVLVVGLGNIGRDCAEKFAGMGARVIGVNRTVREIDGIEQVFPTEELAVVVAQADAIVNALPGTDATYKQISAEVLANVKPGVIVASVGRGTAFDEEALVDGLQSGRIGFAALDVFFVEPLPATSPLWDMDNVIIAPHTAALSNQEDRRIAEMFAGNAALLLDGRRLVSQMNTVDFY